MIAAVLLAFYALAVFDPSISSGLGRVANFQRMGIQQNLTIVSVGLAIVGVLLLIFGPTSQVADRDSQGTVAPFANLDNDALVVEEQFSEAIRNEDLGTVRRLFESRSVSAHGRNKNGRGWLQYATVVGSSKAAEVILEHGASPRDKDDFGRSALEEAEMLASADLVALFSR